MNPNSGNRVVAGTGNKEYLELNRLWVHDNMPKNTESRAISYTVKYIKQVYPMVKWIQSFADERCGRAGVVYQACSFDFIGSHKTTFYELDGEWYHEICKTAVNRSGQRGKFLRENMDRATPHLFTQYRYIKFLKKSARRNLNAKLFKIQPYPKPEG